MKIPGRNRRRILNVFQGDDVDEVGYYSESYFYRVKFLLRLLESETCIRFLVQGLRGQLVERRRQQEFYERGKFYEAFVSTAMIPVNEVVCLEDPPARHSCGVLARKRLRIQLDDY